LFKNQIFEKGTSLEELPRLNRVWVEPRRITTEIGREEPCV
jgi:hypothetical protein